MNKKYALLIGTINEVSISFAKTLIKKEFNIIFVASKTNEKTKYIQKEYSNYNIITLVYNLANITETYKMCEEVSKFNIEMTIFNNNEYIKNQFIDNKIDNIIKLIDNNIKSTQVIMKFLALKFSNKNKGIFINLCSIGAVLPMPKISISFASSSFNYNLFTTVNLEFKKLKSNIRCINIMMPILMPSKIKIPYDNDKLNDLSDYAIEKIYKTKRKSLIKYGFKTKFLLFMSIILSKKFIGSIIAKKL